MAYRPRKSLKSDINKTKAQRGGDVKQLIEIISHFAQEDSNIPEYFCVLTEFLVYKYQLFEQEK